MVSFKPKKRTVFTSLFGAKGETSLNVAEVNWILKFGKFSSKIKAKHIQNETVCHFDDVY